jgi:hypothetical protein
MIKLMLFWQLWFDENGAFVKLMKELNENAEAWQNQS